MKLKVFIANLKKIVKDNPQANNYEVIYSIDDEGSDFKTVFQYPSVGCYDPETHEFQFDDNSDESDDNDAICIN